MCSSNSAGKCQLSVVCLKQTCWDLQCVAQRPVTKPLKNCNMEKRVTYKRYNLRVFIITSLLRDYTERVELVGLIHYGRSSIMCPQGSRQEKVKINKWCMTQTETPVVVQRDFLFCARAPFQGQSCWRLIDALHPTAAGKTGLQCCPLSASGSPLSSFSCSHICVWFTSL